MTTDYWYLGSPYSRYPDGIRAAFEEVAKIAGAFAIAGIPVYSPIAHTHPIAMISGIDPYDHKIWLPFDTPMMLCAKGLIVAQMEGWQHSYGLNEEIQAFAARSKPIRFLSPEEISPEQLRELIRV